MKLNLNHGERKTMAALSHGTPVISIQSLWYSHIAKILSMDFCLTCMYCPTFREYPSFNLTLSLCCPYLLPQFSSPCVVFYQAISIARTSCSLFPHFRRVAADSSSASLLRRIASRHPSTISLVASLFHLLVSQHCLGGQIGCFLVR